MAKRGAKGKLNRKLIEKAAALIRAGNYASTAYGALGVSSTAYYRWLRDADEPDASAILIQFKQSIQEAEEQAEIEALHVINQSAHGKPAVWEQVKGPDGKPLIDPKTGRPMTVRVREEVLSDWRAMAWRMERRNPGKWGKRDKLALEHSGPGGGPIQLEERRTTLLAIAANPELRMLAEQMARALTVNASPASLGGKQDGNGNVAGTDVVDGAVVAAGHAGLVLPHEESKA